MVGLSKVMGLWTPGAGWDVEPRELERVSWWWDSQSDGAVDPVVEKVNQGAKVVPQGNQSSQGVGHVVIPKLEAQSRR